MQSHEVDLRLSINHVETIVGFIAKNPDSELKKHVPQFNLAIANLRECLSTIHVQWQMFDSWHESHDRAEDRPE